MSVCNGSTLCKSLETCDSLVGDVGDSFCVAGASGVVVAVFSFTSSASEMLENPCLKVLDSWLNFELLASLALVGGGDGGFMACGSSCRGSAGGGPCLMTGAGWAGSKVEYSSGGGGGAPEVWAVFWVLSILML